MGFLQKIFNTFTKAASVPQRVRRRRPTATLPVGSGFRRATKRPSRSFTGLRRGTVMLYHGTPSIENARSIVRHGFMVSGANGNALGDGIYFADLMTAKSYAGSSGVYLKCRVNVGRTCVWDTAVAQRYNAWCRKRGATPDNAAKTAFLLSRGYHTLQSGAVVVVLKPRYNNPTAYKRRDPRIHIIDVFHVSNDRKVRV